MGALSDAGEGLRVGVVQNPCALNKEDHPPILVDQESSQKLTPQPSNSADVRIKMDGLLIFKFQ